MRSRNVVLVIGIAVVGALVGGLIGGALIANAYGERLAAAELRAAELATRVDAVQKDADEAAVLARTAQLAVGRVGDGVKRIKLTDALEPEGRFGGIQAFVETGSTERGCIASVSETNVGQLGPFYVLCTPRAPVINGIERKGILLQIRTADAGGRSDKLFPPGSIVEITLWQPGAETSGQELGFDESPRLE